MSRSVRRLVLGEVAVALPVWSLGVSSLVARERKVPVRGGAAKNFGHRCTYAEVKVLTTVLASLADRRSKSEHDLWKTKLYSSECP